MTFTFIQLSKNTIECTAYRSRLFGCFRWLHYTMGHGVC
nr:MAG TPA: hypothetical protein [Caudoviricetes sp.]